MKPIKTAFFIVSFLALSLPLFCQSSEENKKELEKVSKQIQDKIEQQYKLFEEEKSVLYQVQKFDQKLDELKKRVDNCNKKLEQYEQDIGYSKEQIGSESKRLNKVEQDLSDRMRQLYKEGSFKSLKTLMSAVSYEDFMKKYDLLVTIAKKDVELKQNILKKKKELSGKKSDFEKKYVKYESYRKTAAEKSVELTEQKKEKSGLLGGIKDQRALYEQAIAELKQQSGKLENIIKQYDADSRKIEIPRSEGDINKVKGKLQQPSEGKVTSFFGKYKHPKFNVYVFNNGVEITSKLNDPVHPVYSGVVIFADWFKGYGKTVLVDHGNNVVGIYGHLSEISVNFGQKVAAADMLGKVGDTGSSETPTLYFEIRKEGKPQNPLEWLAK